MEQLSIFCKPPQPPIWRPKTDYKWYRPSTVLCELLFSLFIWKRDSCTLTFKSHPTHENTLCGNSLQASHLILTFFVRKVTVAFNCVICAWPKHTITCLVFNWTVSFAWSNSTTARNQFSYQQSSNNVPWIFFFFFCIERESRAQ
jgi:hypothetical protein